MTATNMGLAKERVRHEWLEGAPAWKRWQPKWQQQSRAATELIVRLARPAPGARVLDLASGSGEPALTLAEAVGPKGEVIATDLVPEMMAPIAEAAAARGLRNLRTQAADMESLPFPDASFDAVTARFAVVFCPRIDRALSEMRRVLKPGGRFLCLEFSRVIMPGLAQLYDAYSFRVLPQLGAWVARDRAAYQYLVESIRRFPPQDELVRLMRAAGFERVSYRNLSGGIAALHSGWRI